MNEITPRTSSSSIRDGIESNTYFEYNPSQVQSISKFRFIVFVGNRNI